MDSTERPSRLAQVHEQGSPQPIPGVKDLKLVYEPREANAVIHIIAIHGLGGHYEKSWTHESTKVFWLKDLLPRRIPNACVWSFGYSCAPRAKTIREHSRTLLEEVKRVSKLNEYGPLPVIFLAHSMGGLILIPTLISAALQQSNVIELIHSIFFVGVPHNGLGGFSKCFTEILRRNPHIGSNYYDYLTRQTDMLDFLREQWTMLEKRFEIVDFFENRRTNGVKIVSEGSAAPRGHSDSQRRRMDADHLNVVKYSGEEDPNYKEMINELAYSVSQASQKHKPQHKKDFIISGQRVSYLKGSYDKDKFILRPELCGRFHKLMEEAFPSPASRFGGVQTVIGAPGMGKTFLVHWFAETYDSWFRCKMSVDASREETIIQDLKSVAARLGLAIAQESADIVDTLRRWLETHQEWLIIFDNVPQDFVFTKYCPNNPRGLVFIISHYDLSPIEMRLAPIQVETMNPTEAYHQFCTELGLLPSEDHLSSSSRSPSHGLLDLKLSQPMQQLSSSQDDKVHRFLKVLGFHPLAVQLGIGWIRQRAKYHGEWTKSLDLFIKGFRAHGNAESVIESIAINMLIEPLMNRTKSPDNEDQQGSIEVLRFFSVIDSSGLPESLLEYGWNSIKRKRFNKVDKTSTWSKDRQKKLLGSYLKEKWDSHPIQEAIIDLMSSSLIYVVKQADPIKDSRPWISMHPALHLAVRRAILPRGKEGLMAACSDAIVTLAEMTSLSADADSRMSGHLDQRHSRQNIQSHMKYCFRLCPEVEEQLYAQEDGLIDRIEIVRKYAKACAENGMVSQALRINTRAIKALNESKRDDRVKRMILRVSIEQATNYHDLGKHRDALDIRKKLLTDATDQSIYGSDLYRVCKMNLVRSYHFDRQNLNALRLIEEVITDSGSDPGSEELKNSTSRLKASILFSLESRRPEALQIRQSILQSILGARNAKHMETILSKSGKRAWKFGQISLLSDLATSYHTAGWLLLAKKIRGLVLDHRKKWFPHFPEHHDVLTAQYNLAITLDSLGEAESAEKLLMETGESCKKLSQGGDSLGFQVNLSLKTMKIEEAQGDDRELLVNNTLKFIDSFIRGKDESLRLLASDKNLELLKESNSPVRIQAVLDSGNKTPGEIEKPGGTDESALQKIGNYERLASFHFKLKQHYDAKEYYKRAHLICQRLRPASSAIANGREQNPLSLRVMLRLADAYYALSANTCCCFQPGDTCNRRRLSTASISTNSSSTSDVVEKLTVEDDTLSDEFDRCSLTPEMNPVITQGNACYYHDYWKNKARHYREKVYNMKEIFQEGELDAQSTELYIQSLMNMEPGERDLAQIIRMYEEVAAWKEKFMGRDHKLTQRTRTRLKRSKLLKQDEMARRQGSAQAAGHIDPITTVRQLRTSTFPAAVSAPSTTEESPGTGTEVLLDSQVANGEAPEPQLQPKKHGTILKAFCDRVKRASIKAKVNTRHHKKA